MALKSIADQQSAGKEVTSLVSTDLVPGARSPFGVTNDFVISAANLVLACSTPADGWIAGTGTWSYSSADSPTFVISVNADVTAIIGVGDRIKLTQTTTKYFIVTAVGSYSGSATLVTVYGGTDYTLAAASITSPYYSHQRSPFGFPVDPEKWQVSFSDTTSRSQATPTQNTWYNLGTLSVSIPIGAWRIKCSIILQTTENSANTSVVQATISSANNSESNTKFTAAYVSNVGGATSNSLAVPCTIIGNLKLAAKASYYFNSRTQNASIDTIYFRNDLAPLSFYAECAYL